MYEWFWGIFAKKSKLHDAGGPDTVVSPKMPLNVNPPGHDSLEKGKLILLLLDIY